jgi:hypothetical protein
MHFLGSTYLQRLGIQEASQPKASTKPKMPLVLFLWRGLAKWNATSGSNEKAPIRGLKLKPFGDYCCTSVQLSLKSFTPGALRLKVTPSFSPISPK